MAGCTGSPPTCSLITARRKQRIRFDALSEDAAARLAGTDPGPERTFEFNNLDRDIAAALEALPPDFRAAVVLCDMEGLSYDEVAHALNIKLGTVRSRIHRGRAMLRESLADRAPRPRHRCAPNAKAHAVTAAHGGRTLESVQPSSGCPSASHEAKTFKRYR